MIIVEGCDFIGKTTLCKGLEKRFWSSPTPYTYRHLSRLPDTFNVPWGYLPMFDKMTIMDRMYASRQAYGRVFKNQRTLEPHEVELLDAWASEFMATRVLFIATDAWLRSRKAKYTKDQMYSFEGGVMAVNRAFREIANEFRFELVIKLDGSRWPSDFIETIAQLACTRRRQYDAILLRRPHGALR